jgi:hypothetical protein
MGMTGLDGGKAGNKSDHRIFIPLMLFCKRSVLIQTPKQPFPQFFGHN